MKIIITGGHFSPALSIIEYLKGDRILLAGRKYAFEGEKTLSYEYLTAQNLGIPFVEITTARLQRRVTRFTVTSYLKFPKGFVQSISVIKSFKPDIVLSFGGYVSVPICLAAHFMGVPIILHEQTVKAGLANKFISKISQKICITFSDSEKYFPKNKTVLTGNPVRDEIFQQKIFLKIPEGKKIIYVTGGSTGSHAINKVTFESILEMLSEFTVIHQTGDSKLFKDFEMAQIVSMKLSDQLKKRYIFKKYFFPEEIGYVLNKADVIVSRAGANTVNEILTLGKRSVLIPLPQGQENEQMENARIVSKHGFSIILSQDNLSKKSLIDSIHDSLELIQKTPVDVYSKDAEKKIYSVVKEVYEQNKKKKD